MKPQGTASAGRPVMLKGAMLLRANGKSGVSTVSKEGAGPGVVGVSQHVDRA